MHFFDLESHQGLAVSSRESWSELVSKGPVPSIGPVLPMNSNGQLKLRQCSSSLAPSGLQYTLEFNVVWLVATPPISLTMPMFPETNFTRIWQLLSGTGVGLAFFSRPIALRYIEEVSMRPPVIFLHWWRCAWRVETPVPRICGITCRYRRTCSRSELTCHGDADGLGTNTKNPHPRAKLA